MDVLENHEVDFGRNEDVYNVMSKVVMPPTKAQEYLDHERIGEDLYKTFKEERFEGEKSIWDTLTKRKLSTFVNPKKPFLSTARQKITEIKEEKKLLTKIVVASRSRNDIDLAAYLGAYEFTNVPRSMFRPDGSLLLGTDKSSILHEIENQIKITENSMEVDCRSTENQSVIIFDGMAVVNRLKKTSKMKTWKNLAEEFIRKRSQWIQ